MKQLPTGIERTPFGFRAWQWANGRNRSKRFRAGALDKAAHAALLKKMQAWQESIRVAARTKATIATARTVEGFVADVATYLDAVKTMTSFRDRVRDMQAWMERLGDKPSLEITALDIRLARDAWRTKGPRHVQRKNPDTGVREWVAVPEPLAASSVNHRLRALENFFTVMYPKADNPVRDVDECDEPPLQPKGQTFALGYEVLSFMPDRTAPKKGGTHEAGSLSRIRYETMLVTGLTPKQVGLLKDEHVDWTVPSLVPPRRIKGRRSRRARARQQPKARSLMPAALPVLRRLFAMKANRPFSETSLGRSVKRAIRAANVARAKRRQPLPAIPLTLTPYELTRHTFGTEIYRSTKNLKVVQELLGHSDIRQSDRYALAAVQEHQVVAVGSLSRVARRAQRQHGESSPSRSPQRRKSQRNGKRTPPPEP